MSSCGKMSPSEKAAMGNQDEREDAVRVSGIARFRPCEDWLGEYGFDWIREENDVFMERILDTPSTTSTFIMECTMRNKRGDKAVDKWKKEHSYEKWKENQYKQKEASEKKMKELMDKKMDPEVLEVLLDSAKISLLNAQKNIDNIENNEELARETYATSYDNDLISEIEPYQVDNYAREAWKDKVNNTNDKYFTEIMQPTRADRVFEYCYQPQDVEKVVYRATGKGIWERVEIEYLDTYNGDIAAKDREGALSDPSLRGILDVFIDINGMHQLSCVLEGDKIAIPMYCEDFGNEDKWSKKNEKFYFTEEGGICGNDNYLFSAEEIVNKAVRLIDEDAAKVMQVGKKEYYTLKQLYKSKVNAKTVFEPFSSNIMDYDNLGYSLHKYQWDIMRENAANFCKEYYLLTHQNE